MAGIEEEWPICHSDIAAAKLAMSCFPTNSITLDRLRAVPRPHAGSKMLNLVTDGGCRPNLQRDQSGTATGRRCPSTPTDPPGSISAEFNDGATRGVVPIVTFLGK